MLVCPARDEAENVAAEILAALLEPGKWEVRVAGDEVLASEMIAKIEEFQPAAIVLISLPPGGLSHCRYLMKRIQGKFRDSRVIVGRWGDEETSPDQSPNLLNGVDAVDRCLTDTLKRLTALHPVLLAEIEKQDAEMKQEPATGKSIHSKTKEESAANAALALK